MLQYILASGQGVAIHIPLGTVGVRRESSSMVKTYLMAAWFMEVAFFLSLMARISNFGRFDPVRSLRRFEPVDT